MRIKLLGMVIPNQVWLLHMPLVEVAVCSETAGRRASVVAASLAHQEAHRVLPAKPPCCSREGGWVLWS